MFSIYVLGTLITSVNSTISPFGFCPMVLYKLSARGMVQAKMLWTDDAPVIVLVDSRQG